MLPIQRSSVGLFALFTLTLLLGSQLVWNIQFQTLATTHQAELDKFSEHISTKLDKYAHLPRLLAKDTELIDALRTPENTAQIELSNRYLENVNRVIQASDTYLLDRFGTTIASSNWNLNRSFIGRNFAWRPYYQDAISGEQSQYFALGSTSGQRGYYYSYPIIYAAEVIGVVVVKMDLSAIERNWSSKGSYFVATDKNNIIFMSSKSEWLFKSLRNLTSEQRQDIANSRQYLDTPISSLSLSGDLTQPNTQLNQPQSGWFRGSFITSARTVEGMGLTLRVLSPKQRIIWPTVWFVVMTCLVFAVIFLILLLVYNRQQKHRQLAQIHAEANQKLEFLVMERTSALHAEVNERTKAEHALRKTQDELIQAAKLAVLGQLSASISHELNNPLAAIRSFADNGRRFLDKEKYDRVDDNLSRISRLTDRMAKISEQLKAFTRKSDQDGLQRVNVQVIISSAIELISPQIKSKRVTLDLQLPDMPLAVEVNIIQLEQILINLFSNAIQAVEEQDKRILMVSVLVEHNTLSILIDDNGPGIAEDKHIKLFEPFYTTKKNGLGLGLSISLQIIKAMKGQLSVSHAPLGGARFVVTLPLVQQSSIQQGVDNA